jgi:deoxyribodipyrimidine photolyase-related protein
MARVRHLVIVLGDQLDHTSAAFDGFDAARDLIWMAEVSGEATRVLSHKVRIVFFLTAMRHFATELRAKNYKLEYRKLDALDNRGELGLELRAAIEKFKPERVVVVEAGEQRVEVMLKSVAKAAGVTLEIRTDRHFYCSREEFAAWAGTRKQLRMEFFYREMRKRSGILMERGEPVAAEWNFDTDNRKSFGKSGPGLLLSGPAAFPPDAVTSEVIELVNRRFEKHPGSLEHFDFPVNATDACTALNDFIRHRLPEFGQFQDAMWSNEPYLFHSRISGLLNLKLLDPRRVLMAAEDAYHRGEAPIASVEGFIRQILGWREYVRGIYWTYMPKYLGENALNAQRQLPDFYWTGETDMHCLRQVLGQTLTYGYAHHIQRLMVTGLFSLLFGVKPVEVHKWYLAIYWDAVEWVELPNTVGMSQYADGGLMGSKPYIASGKYISRMSNYCLGCRYKPENAVGEDACPFTTLYWDFLMQHRDLLAQNQRMKLQVRNLERLSAEKKEGIQTRATELRAVTPTGNY